MILTDKQRQAVILAALKTGPKTESELARFLDGAEEAIVRATSWELVFSGDLVIDCKDGEVTFSEAWK